MFVGPLPLHIVFTLFARSLHGVFVSKWYTDSIRREGGDGPGAGCSVHRSAGLPLAPLGPHRAGERGHLAQTLVSRGCADRDDSIAWTFYVARSPRLGDGRCQSGSMRAIKRKVTGRECSPPPAVCAATSVARSSRGSTLSVGPAWYSSQNSIPTSYIVDARGRDMEDAEG